MLHYFDLPVPVNIGNTSIRKYISSVILYLNEYWWNNLKFK